MNSKDAQAIGSIAYRMSLSVDQACDIAAMLASERGYTGKHLPETEARVAYLEAIKVRNER